MTEYGGRVERDRPGEQPETAPSLVHFLDPRDSRPVNPNTPEGEIRNMAAFAAGVHQVTPWRRAVAKLFVWLILLGLALGIIVGVVDAAHVL